VMPKCDEIRSAVCEYDNENSKSDLALRSAVGAVRSLPPTPERFLAEVCLIADWGTIQLTGFSFEGRVAMAKEIEGSWPVLQSMQGLAADDWDAQTKLLTDAVDRLSDHTQLLPKPGAEKHQLSFLSKYLHNCVNDAFPIWDRNARAALNNGNDERSWLSYRNWVICARQEAATHRACCLEQISPGEGILRTLDKALYILGRRGLRKKAGQQT
jgi:hypothetical protein